MSKSPTQRSLEYLRKQGYMAGVVERRVPKVHTTIDLFGCIDIIAISDSEVIGIQATSRPNVAARLTKIRNLPHYEQLKASPIRVLVHGWSKMASGKYELREEPA